MREDRGFRMQCTASSASASASANTKPTGGPACCPSSSRSLTVHRPFRRAHASACTAGLRRETDKLRRALPPFSAGIAARATSDWTLGHRASRHGGRCLWNPVPWDCGSGDGAGDCEWMGAGIEFITSGKLSHAPCVCVLGAWCLVRHYPRKGGGDRGGCSQYSRRAELQTGYASEHGGLTRLDSHGIVAPAETPMRRLDDR